MLNSPTIGIAIGLILMGVAYESPLTLAAAGGAFIGWAIAQVITPSSQF